MSQHRKQPAAPPARSAALLAIASLLLGAVLFIITGAEATLLLILPFALGGALSPVMLTQQTLLLTTEQGRRAAGHYALGAALVLAGFVFLSLFFGRLLALPQEPEISSQLDIFIGAGMLVIAAGLEAYRRKSARLADRNIKQPAPSAFVDQQSAGRKRRRLGSWGALGFGSFSMATNFTTLALMVPAAKMIAAGQHLVFERLILALVLVAIAAAPAWLPVALTHLAPQPAERWLQKLEMLIAERGRELLNIAIAALGLFLLAKGLLG